MRDWNSRNKPSNSLSEGEQRRMAGCNIVGLISRVESPAPDNGLDVLRLGDDCLRDRHTLMELRRLLSDEQAEEE